VLNFYGLYYQSKKCGRLRNSDDEAFGLGNSAFGWSSRWFDATYPRSSWLNPVAGGSGLERDANGAGFDGGIRALYGLY
jgi:hypothetical protein